MPIERWWVLILPGVLFVLHLVHFLFKRNLSEKNLSDWESNQGPSDPQPSFYPLSYRAIDIINAKIDFYISPQTLDQYWSSLVPLVQFSFIIMKSLLNQDFH